jgi:hypothetical protein
MGRAGAGWVGVLAGALAALAACAGGSGGDTTAVSAAQGAVAAGGPSVTAAVAATAPSSTEPAATAPPQTAAPTTVAPTTAVPTTDPPSPPAARFVVQAGWAPFATFEGLTLVHPAARVERVGFHQSNHDGARPLEPLPSAAAPVTLEDRERGTAPRSAADIVVEPGQEIRAVVTGKVKRAGRYVLYCRHTDHFLVVAPDSHPTWEVKMLHIAGLHVRAGDRVVAGETVVAPAATQLPFQSQVDELAPVAPAWPHVHVEVVDPSIPDRPNPGGSNCN